MFEKAKKLSIKLVSKLSGPYLLYFISGIDIPQSRRCVQYRCVFIIASEGQDEKLHRYQRLRMRHVTFIWCSSK